MRAARAREIAALAAVLALGALARLPFVTTGLWRDEAVSVADVAPASFAAAAHRIAASELSPPGYFLLLKAWLGVAGTSDLAVKLPSLVCGVATIGATFALGRRLGGARAGLLAAVLAAGAQDAIVLAGDARPYALAALLAACAAWCALRTLAADGRRYAVAYAAGAYAVMAVQYTGIVLVASLAGVAAARALGRRERRGAVRLLVATAAAALAYVPLVPQFVAVATAPTPWRAAVSPGTVVGRTLEQFSYVLPVDVAHVAFALACAAALIATAFANRRAFAGPGAERVTAYALLVTPVLAATALETRAALGDPRYMFAFTPLADALLGAGAVALVEPLARAVRARRVTGGDLARAVFAVAVVAIVAGALPKQLALDRATFALPELSGMRAAVRASARDLDARTLVVVAPDYLAPGFRYYVPDPRVRAIGFARRERPEVARLIDPYAPWFAPGLVDAALADVRARAAHGRTRVALVSEPGARDAGRVPFALTERFRAGLAAHARVLSDRTFRGRYENVEVTLLDLR